MKFLSTLADVATIITAAVAVYGYGHYRWMLSKRRRKIEAQLAKKNQPNDDSLTVEQLAAASVMTIEQVIEAASRSKKIEGVEGLNKERRLRYKL